MARYFRPSDLEEALSLLAAGDLTIAAGCTDLFPATQAKSLPGDILDIGDIGALRGISQTGDGWRIGAATTWTDILWADLPPAFDGLKLAAKEVGSVQIQNAGTIAGNLCTASPAGDGAPCLLTLDAKVDLRSANTARSLPLQEFLTGARQTALRKGELVCAIHIPKGAARGTCHFLKLGAREYLVISIAMVAARLVVEDGLVTQAALAVGSCSPTATRLPDLEAALVGQAVSRASVTVSRDLVAVHLTPIDDIRADSAYRTDAATELLRRAVHALAAPMENAA